MGCQGSKITHSDTESFPKIILGPANLQKVVGVHTLEDFGADLLEGIFWTFPCKA